MTKIKNFDVLDFQAEKRRKFQFKNRDRFRLLQPDLFVSMGGNFSKVFITSDFDWRQNLVSGWNRVKIQILTFLRFFPNFETKINHSGHTHNLFISKRHSREDYG